MAIPLWAALMAAGVAKSELIDRPKEERQRKLAATTQELSPWTGMQANQIQEADTFGAALQGGTSGLAMGQSMDSADKARELQSAQIEAMREQSNLYRDLMKNRQATSPMLAKQNPTMDYWSQMMERPMY
jgi:hypothetical protein